MNIVSLAGSERTSLLPVDPALPRLHMIFDDKEELIGEDKDKRTSFHQSVATGECMTGCSLWNHVMCFTLYSTEESVHVEACIETNKYCYPCVTRGVVSKIFYKHKSFFFEKVIKKLEGEWISQSQASFWKQGSNEQVCQVWELSSYLYWDQFSRRIEECSLKKQPIFCTVVSEKAMQLSNLDGILPTMWLILSQSFQ